MSKLFACRREAADGQLHCKKFWNLPSLEEIPEVYKECSQDNGSCKRLQELLTIAANSKSHKDDPYFDKKYLLFKNLENPQRHSSGWIYSVKSITSTLFRYNPNYDQRVNARLAFDKKCAELYVADVPSDELVYIEEKYLPLKSGAELACSHINKNVYCRPLWSTPTMNEVPSLKGECDFGRNKSSCGVLNRILSKAANSKAHGNKYYFGNYYARAKSETAKVPDRIRSHIDFVLSHKNLYERKNTYGEFLQACKRLYDGDSAIDFTVILDENIDSGNGIRRCEN
jgi:hypothetical protein